MRKDVYKKESSDHISSPEQLKGYLQAANPKMWIALVALVVFVVGVVIWGSCGKVEYQAQTTASIEKGHTTLYLDQLDFSEVTSGMTVRIDNAEGVIISVAEAAEQLGGTSDLPPLAVADIGIGNWYYRATAEMNLPDGEYPAFVVTKSLSPLALLFS